MEKGLKQGAEEKKLQEYLDTKKKQQLEEDMKYQIIKHQKVLHKRELRQLQREIDEMIEASEHEFNLNSQTSKD